jgi:hypothetical protein
LTIGSPVNPLRVRPRPWLVQVLRLAAGSLALVAALFCAGAMPDSGADLEAEDAARCALASTVLAAPEVPPGEMVAGWADDDELRASLPAVHPPDRPSFVTVSAFVAREPRAPRYAARRTRRHIERGPPVLV